ncbi:hypothetical protein DXT63_08555 [Thermoanaerobacteraceae bacterium SP2]|nr:hypothetical protein DXT63_08555 [Thermoanaerobacteraceae bacterium SP2]
MNRYTQIHTQIWFDEKIQTLDDDCKLLFIYLLTSPHSNMIGYYRLPKEYTAVDLKWDIKRTTIAFEKLSAAQLIKYDNQSNVILILNFLKYNPIQGENQAKGAVKQAQDIPKSPLLMDFLECIEKYVPDYYNLFEPLLDGIRTPFEAPSNPLAGSGTGTGTGKDNINTCASANAECVIDTSAEKPSDTTEDGGAQQKERVKTASAGKGEDYTPEFEQFWAIYPRKVEKRKAFRVWNTRLKEKISPHDMITAARNYAAYCKKQSIEARYIKHPGTFLGPDKPFTDFIKEVVIDGTSERSFSTNDETKPDPRDKLFARTLD